MHNNGAIGQPVAWCLSDREDTQVMEVFLGAVHMQSPEAGVCVVMTDDGT